MRYSKQLCLQFQHGAEILGKRWTGMIVELLLAEGPRRFNEIAALMEVVSDRVLSERLKELEAEGIVAAGGLRGHAGEGRLQPDGEGQGPQADHGSDPHLGRGLG